VGRPPRFLLSLLAVTTLAGVAEQIKLTLDSTLGCLAQLISTGKSSAVLGFTTNL
jgi:hypothetical protein